MTIRRILYNVLLHVVSVTETVLRFLDEYLQALRSDIKFMLNRITRMWGTCKDLWLLNPETTPWVLYIVNNNKNRNYNCFCPGEKEAGALASLAEGDFEANDQL